MNLPDYTNVIKLVIGNAVRNLKQVRYNQCYQGNEATLISRIPLHPLFTLSNKNFNDFTLINHDRAQE